MVASMRYWATAAGIIGDATTPNRLDVTPLGRKIFGDNGLDAYMENPATLWLVHWQLCGRPNRTTWYWAYNYYPAVTFDREHLVKGLMALAGDRDWPRVSGATVKRDVECFVRTYAARPPSGKISHEDALECPLTELGLIRAIGKKDGFRFVRSAKSSLGDGVFSYALIDFWSRFTKAHTLSFEAVAHEPGSPGRVFLLDENDLVDRLVDIDQVTNGAIRWSETAGLKQLIRQTNLDGDTALGLITFDYHKRLKRKAA